MTNPRRIVVAVDFSEDADVAVELAGELARERGAELHVVHAYELPIKVISPYEVAVPDRYIAESRRAAQQRLDACVEKLVASGLSARAHLAEVPAAPAIAALAEKLGAELVVMGSRGLGGLKHFLLGSVAERTLRLSPCSVLVAKGSGARSASPR